MKQLLDVAHGKLINIIGRHGILDIFMDVSHTLEMTISYRCIGLFYEILPWMTHIF